MKGSLRNLLANKLKSEELSILYKSYDIIGDIAVIRVPKSLELRSGIIADAIMQTHKRVRTVLRQVSPISGDLRLRKLEWVRGERKTETFHKEFGCVFKVGLEKCYFSPRLSYERMRVARLVKPNEVIVNLFAGVGCYSIVIAKHSEAKKIFSMDINPIAVKYMRENVEINKVGERVFPLEGDAKKIVEEKLQNVADRVLMPLPEKAYEYLDSAVLALKLTGGWISYYDFVHAGKDENPVEKIERKVSEKLKSLNINFEISFGRVVRTTGPNWYQVAIDIKVLPS